MARPCFYSAHLLDYHPFAQAPENKEGFLALPFLLFKGVATSNPKLLFHENNISFISKRNTDIKEIHLVLGYWVFVHEKITQIGCHVSEAVPATNMVQVVPSHENMGCVHKPGTVKFIVFNVQSFSCERYTNQSTLDSWWRLKNNADLLVNFWLCQ